MNFEWLSTRTLLPCVRPTYSKVLLVRLMICPWNRNWQFSDRSKDFIVFYANNLACTLGWKSTSLVEPSEKRSFIFGLLCAL